MNDKNNKKKNELSTEKCIMIVGFVLGSFLLDVSVVLGLVVIIASFVLPGILKARGKLPEGKLGETVKTVINEAKGVYKEQYIDDDDDEDDALPTQVEPRSDTLDDDDDGIPDVPIQEEGSLSKWLTEAKKAEETESCEQDHIHAEQYRSLSDDDKRREQLKGMLEAGLIDKKEYKLLLKKYGLK